MRIRPEVDLGSRSFDEDRRVLRDVIASSESSKREMSPWLAVIPYMAYMIAALVVVLAMLALAFEYIRDHPGGYERDFLRNVDGLEGPLTAIVVIAAVFYTYYGILAFILIKRANEHHKREVRARSVISDLMVKIDPLFASSCCHDPRLYTAGSDSVRSCPDKMMNPFLGFLIIIIPLLYIPVEISALATGDIEDIVDGRYLWLNYLLTFVHAILMFYLLHSLTQEMSKHDMRWHEFTRQVKISFARRGFVAGNLYSGSVLERRSSALYVVLSFVTLGIFIVYWWYSIVKDQNEHFRKQRLFENGLLKLVEGKVKGAF